MFEKNLSTNRHIHTLFAVTFPKEQYVNLVCYQQNMSMNFGKKKDPSFKKKSKYNEIYLFLREKDKNYLFFFSPTAN